MKTVDENSSDRELLFELLKCAQRIEKKLPDGNTPTLQSLGFMSNDEFMGMFEIGEAKASKLRESGELRFTMIGRAIYYKIADVLDLLNANFNRQ